MSSIKLSQTPVDTGFETFKHGGYDRDYDLDFKSIASDEESRNLYCCNSKLIQALKSAQLSESLSLLSDPDVINGLKELKKLSTTTITDTEKTFETAFTGPLANLPIETEPKIKQEPTAASLGLTQPFREQASSNILEIQIDSSARITADDFDAMGSPGGRTSTGKRGRPTGDSRCSTPKKLKSLNEPGPSDYALMAEMKRKLIRDCNIALKACRPQKDTDRVILVAINKLGRDMYLGPNPPFALYKLLSTLFPEWNNLNTDERINKLHGKLARFISKNIEWTEVCLNTYKVAFFRELTVKCNNF